MIIFFDRDGVLVPSLEINGKPKPSFKLNDNIDKKISNRLSKLKKNSCYMFLVTNQPDIKRGLKDKKELIKENDYIVKKLKIDDWAMCEHDNLDNCDCRKPKIGMYKKLLKKWNLSLKNHKSYMLGDRVSDMIAGKEVGCFNIFIDHNYIETKGFKDYDQCFNDTNLALDFIIKSNKLNK